MPPIKSIQEWVALPKLEFPVILKESQEGKVCRVLKAGFAAVPLQECEEQDIAPDLIEFERGLLPTCVVRLAAGDILHQLPLSLAEWTLFVVGLSVNGMNPFPCDVEFGMLRDREYAEML